MTCPFQEIVRRCANLPRGAAIFYLSFVTDSQGGTYADERMLADLHATANAPLFARHSVMLGRGVVGGRLMSMEDLGRTTADAAIRLLNGAPPENAKDRRNIQVHRYSIGASSSGGASPRVGCRPPASCAIELRACGSEYKFVVLSAAGALSRPIALDCRAAVPAPRTTAGRDRQRRNLALAVDASRRQTMSALTNSIAHELGQPLSSMIHNAQALQMMMAANRATPDTMGEILSDIQSQGVQATQIIDRHRMMLRGRQLDTKPIDLHTVIDESLALVAHDMRITADWATVDSSSNPCLISGDQVLLQQVLVNLVVNARTRWPIRLRPDDTSP